jgi:peptide/nickel transport system substrate-binding protein
VNPLADCAVEVAAVRREPRDDAEQVTQLLPGESVDVEERFDGWSCIRTAYDYPGWVRTDVLAERGDPAWLGPARAGDILERNPGYWGRPARVDRLVFRPLPGSPQRAEAVRSGAVDIADLYGRSDVEDVRSDEVRIVSRPPFDVGYVGVNQRHAPLDRRAVREALARGLDRAAVVREWYVPGAEVAREFTPPTLAGYAAGVPAYAYAPERSRDLLRRAGLAVPVPIELWYPTVVRRPYLPEPEEIARRFAAGLERAGFDVTLRGAPWLPDYIRAVRTGEAAVYLLGWIGDYADPSAFLNVLFGSGSTQFGFVNPPLTRLLARAEAEPEPTARAALYRRTNRELMRFLPGVPFVSTRQPVAVRRGVRGYRPSPLGIDMYAAASIGA